MRPTPESASVTPRVSAVIIFFDALQFLEEAITSVFWQTYANWELLLVDDGSTDGSTAIARRYADEWPNRVRYLEHRGHVNRGMSASRNLGIAQARGEFLAFLDADDTWLPHKLEQQVMLLQSYPAAGMVYGRTVLWHSWTGDPQDATRDVAPEHGAASAGVIQPPGHLASMLTRRTRAPCTCSMLLRRDVVTAVGGFETAFRGMHEDQVFAAKMYLAAPVIVADEVWDRYRQHPGSCSAITRATGRRDAARARFLKWLDAYLSSRGLRGDELWATVQRERRALHVDRRRRLVATAREATRRVVPARVRRRLGAWWRGEPFVPPRGTVRFGDLRRLRPVGRHWGKDRGGTPIDRVYIGHFLGAHAMDIHGRVLEVGDDSYARAFGGARVEHCDVLHAVPGNPRATFVADLATGEGVPSDAYDCVILTQVLHLILHPAAAICTVHRILKPGGVVLATLAGISQISRWDMERWGDFWRFTTLSAERLFAAAFPPDHVTVEAHGNVLATVAFLHGLAAEELRPEELDHHDPDFQLLITVRAVRPGGD